MYFIFNGSDKEFRKNHFKETLELYYRELKEALERLEVDPDTVYSREDFDFEEEKASYFYYFNYRLYTADREFDAAALCLETRAKKRKY